jgi:hypothetical protein
MLLSKRELKIFFTFFILYSFFVYWIGWNEQSHLALTRAIVDESRLEIDSYANQTSDRAFYNDHYYSDKDPGPSFLAIPIYGTWEFIYNNFFSNAFKEKYASVNTFIATEVGENKVAIIDYINPGFFILVSMILVTIFTSSLLSALTVVLIYKISKYFTKNEKYRLLLIIIAGLGTLLFPYALVFMKHAISTFFAFLAFFILFKVKHEKIKDNKYFLFSGLSLGFAITCDITTVIIGLACLVYLISFRKEKTTYFLIGGLLGVLPFIVYNYLVFENPLTLSRNYMDPKIWSELGGIKGLEMPNPFVMLRLLFYPEKGLFFYYPILLLSFVGLYYMYKKFRVESILILFMFFSFVILNSSWWAWWGGASFGPRHLTPIIPFLIIPLAYIFIKFNKVKIVKIFISILICFSIFSNLVSLQMVRDEFSGGKTVIALDPQYEKEINTFQIIKNPIYDYYLPLFLENGSRSRILENIMKNEINMDIRITPLSEYIFPFSKMLIYEITLFSIPGLGILDLKMPFFSLFILICFIFLIWIKELFKSIRKLKFKILFLLFLLTIFMVFFTRIINISYKENWYDTIEINNIQFRHMSQNATYILFNYENLEKVKFYFNISSPFKTRTLNLYLNNKLIDSFIISEQTTTIATPLLNILPGENILLFNSKEGCDIPSKIASSNDTRCISFTISNIIQSKLEDIKNTMDYYNGWYQLETVDNITFRHMNQNATIFIYNFENITKKVNLNFNISSDENITRNLNIFLNNKLVESYKIPPYKTEINSALNITSGENILLFNSKEGCSIPSYSVDKRCVSFSIYDIELIK